MDSMHLFFPLNQLLTIIIIIVIIIVIIIIINIIFIIRLSIWEKNEIKQTKLIVLINELL